MAVTLSEVLSKTVDDSLPLKAKALSAKEFKVVIFGDSSGFLKRVTTRLVAVAQYLERENKKPPDFETLFLEIQEALLGREIELAELEYETLQTGVWTDAQNNRHDTLHEEMGVLRELLVLLEGLAMSVPPDNTQATNQLIADALTGLNATRHNNTLEVTNHSAIINLRTISQAIESQIAVPAFDPRSNPAQIGQLIDALDKAKKFLQLAENDVSLFEFVDEVRKNDINNAKRVYQSVIDRATMIDNQNFANWKIVTDGSSLVQDVSAITTRFSASISAHDLSTLATLAIAKVPLVQQELTAIMNQVDPQEQAAKANNLSTTELFTLKVKKIQYFEELIQSLNQIITANTEKKLIDDQFADIRKQIEIAKRQSAKIIAERNSVQTNFDVVFQMLERLKQKASSSPEINALELEILTAQFEKYENAYLEEMCTLEKSDMNPAALGNESKQLIDAVIFGEMNSILVRIQYLDAGQAVIASDRLERLKKDHNIRLAACFDWVGGLRDQLVNGSSQRDGARGVIKLQNVADMPLTGIIAKEDFVTTDLDGALGTNVAIGIRRVVVPKKWISALDLRLVQNQRDVGGDEVEITYTETAMERVWSILDEIFEKIDASNPGLKQIVVNGLTHDVPTDAEGKPLRAGMFHNQMGDFVDFIHSIEEREQVLAGKLGPRFSKEFIARAIKLYVMVTWNHVALSPSSIEGMSDLNYYAIDWLTYAINETFKYRYAKYSFMPTAFLLCYSGTNPWMMFKPAARNGVKNIIKQHGHGKYDYLLGPMISVVNTSSTPGRPHFTVFSPPLRSTLLGRDSVGERLRHNGGNGLLMTLDDVRDRDGKRIYGLMPLQKMPGSIATICGNFGQNAIDGVLLSCLMKDVSEWDSATIINKLKKDARYATSMFPKIGMEIEAATIDGDNRGSQNFLNRISVYLVLIKILNMAMPKEVLRGQGKDLEYVRDYLTSQVTSKIITEEDKEILLRIATGIFQWDIFSAQFADEFIKQLTAATYFGAK